MKDSGKQSGKQSYNPEAEAEEVMKVESQYVSGEKYNSMPVSDEESLMEQ